MAKETVIENGETVAKPKTRIEQDREAWEAYWKIMDIESKGNALKRVRYYGGLLIDKPATWFREKVVDPWQEKNQLPYYHRRFNRLPSIDQCKVGDYVCAYEANWQYRIDKSVDAQILAILRERKEKCVSRYGSDKSWKCAKCIDDHEEADLNYYIKHGELGMNSDATKAYMKQKHRMIWERRHPKIMQLRQEAFEKHKENTAKGIFDYWFWKRYLVWQFRDYSRSIFLNKNQEQVGPQRTNAYSQDPLYYKEKEETGKKEPSEGHGYWETFP